MWPRVAGLAHPEPGYVLASNKDLAQVESSGEW